MSRPFTRAQALENRAFLKLLRKTGNVRLACRELGLKYGTMQDRRRKHSGFAVRWDAAVVFAAARFARVGVRGPSVGRARCSPLRPLARGAGPSTLPSPLTRRFAPPSPARGEGPGYRTQGGEPVIVRLKSGRLQMRRAQPDKLTREGEQAYLAALSATCNKSLAAAAVGAAFNAFARRRKKDPGFARELGMALEQGYLALEMALIEARTAASHEHDDWRSNDPPATPPMSVSQALQLMYLHQKEARLNAVEPHEIRRRAREPEEAHHERLVRMAEERLRREREKFDVAEALRRERGEPDERGFGLPDLAQVTGWSRADPAKAPHHPERALFGGWRIEDMEAVPRRRPGPRPLRSSGS